MDLIPVADPQPYDLSPTLLIVGTNAAWLERAGYEALVGGYRAMGTIAPAEVVPWLNGHVLPHVVIACADSDDLDFLTYLAQQPIGLIVLFPATLIDPIYALLSHVRATLLCDPQVGDVAAALALLPPIGAAVFSDVKGEGEAIRLRRLTEEVGRIARTLAQLSQTQGNSDFNGVGDIVRNFYGEGPQRRFAGEVPDAAAVRDVIRRRRLRDRFFGEGLFADPAWDILLDLYAARLEGKHVSVSSLCIAAAVPPTTALRWITVLTEKGMLVREADPQDRRRIYIALSDSIADTMTAWFNAADR